MPRDLDLSCVHQVDEIAGIFGKVDDLPGLVLAMIGETLDPRQQIAAHVPKQGMTLKGQSWLGAFSHQTRLATPCSNPIAPYVAQLLVLDSLQQKQKPGLVPALNSSAPVEII